MEARSVEMPFIIIGLIVLIVAIFLWRTPLPEIVEEDNSLEVEGSILKEKNLMLGVLAQFFYVGAQVCVSSFFIRYSAHVAGLEERSAAELLSWALLAFMIGRFLGTFLMKYIAPARLLAIYSINSFILLIIAVMAEGMISVYAIFMVEFFMSIMFPTIFSLSIRGLGSKTKQGSSLVIMSIVGGAIFPVNIQTAYIVPALCFGVILYFAVKNINVKEIKMVASH
jgi:FHS family L-fucose permease-like MFS transporter